MARSLIPRGFLMTVLAVYGCGGAQEITTQAGEDRLTGPGAVGQVTATSDEAGGRPVPLPVERPGAPAESVPRPDDRGLPSPVIERAENRNQRVSPIGTLCWARREVVRTVLSGSSQDASLRRFEEVAPLVKDLLGENASELPPGVQPFAARFLADIVSAEGALRSTVGMAPSDRLSAVISSFDFEKYPGVSDFLAAAGASSECVDI